MVIMKEYNPNVDKRHGVDTGIDEDDFILDDEDVMGGDRRRRGR